MNFSRLPLSTLGLVALFSGSAAAQLVVFDEVALITNTLDPSFGRGVAMVDLDGDGYMDIVCADAEEPNKFFQQLPGGTFQEATSLWGVAVIAEFDWGVLAADFDNDGDDDLYFGNGGSGRNANPGRPFPNQLLRNDIQSLGSLTDVSAQSGDAMVSDPTFGVTALDFDRDGFLDIFCSNRMFACTLLRNEGGLVFDDVAAQANVDRVDNWRHCGSADYNNDGWPDIAVGNRGGDNALYENLQDGTFVDNAVAAGVADPLGNFGMVFQDYDNDGLQDIYIAKYQLTPTGPSPVYLNNGDGTFRNVSAGTGMGAHTDMGHESADLNNDGYPEILMGTGNPAFLALDHIYWVLPNGAGGLLINDISTGSGFNSGGITRQHGQGIGDYDRDGDIDVYCNNGGPSSDPTTRQSNLFWRNQGNSSPWAALEVEGISSNRTGVGLVAKASTTEGRSIYRTLQVGRGFSNTPDHALHFGIGSDTQIERVELQWPSGIFQSVDVPLMNAYTKIYETGLLMSGSAAIGQSITFDAAGPPGDVLELFLSMTLGTSEIDGINGSLFIAAPYITLPAFPLDASGRLSLTIPIPNLPSLVGLTFHSQGWIRSATGFGTLSQLHSFTIQ